MDIADFDVVRESIVGITSQIRVIDFDGAAERVFIAKAVQVVLIKAEGIENRGREFVEMRFAPEGDAPPAIRSQRNLEHVRARLKKGCGDVQIPLPSLDMGANNPAPLREAFQGFE